MADDSEDVIRTYLNDGEFWSIRVGEDVAGVVLMTLHERIAEIKNMAVKPSFRGQGIGRFAIEKMESHYGDHGFELLIVGTGNSSIGNLAFYQKVGFRMEGIRKNYFLENYPLPIWEDGIQCTDMVLFEKNLKNRT